MSATEADDSSLASATAVAAPPTHARRAPKRRHSWATHWAAKTLEGTDVIVYVLVGICFFLAALFSLAYGLTTFTSDVLDLRGFPPAFKGFTATSIIALVSDLLLTLIIMEVLGTVVHHLREKETTLRPFLFIGIISATRGILAVGARLSVSSNLSDSEFIHAMVELGVNAAVIIALGVAMKLIGTLLDDSATVPHKRERDAD
ncbi:MAG TPA: phosphate-starvation-inducible PsiE family protein [Ktedonobacterales bacterium]